MSPKRLTLKPINFTKVKHQRIPIISHKKRQLKRSFTLLNRFGKNQSRQDLNNQIPQKLEEFCKLFNKLVDLINNVKRANRYLNQALKQSSKYFKVLIFRNRKQYERLDTANILAQSYNMQEFIRDPMANFQIQIAIQKIQSYLEKYVCQAIEVSTKAICKEIDFIAKNNYRLPSHISNFTYCYQKPNRKSFAQKLSQLQITMGQFNGISVNMRNQQKKMSSALSSLKKINKPIWELTLPSHCQ